MSAQKVFSSSALLNNPALLNDLEPLAEISKDTIRKIIHATHNREHAGQAHKVLKKLMALEPRYLGRAEGDAVSQAVAREATLVTLDLEEHFEAKRLNVTVEVPEVPAQPTGVTHLPDLDLYAVPETDFTDLPENQGIVGSGCLGIVRKGRAQLVRDSSVFGLKGRSAEQRIAIAHLINPATTIVSLGGNAGTGKSALALAAALEGTVERKKYKKILVFRPLVPVGTETLGHLKGTLEEKVAPWAKATFECLETLMNSDALEYVQSKNVLEVEPVMHVRGRTLTDTFIIVDEAQQLDTLTLKTLITRVGKNSKIVLTHDQRQRDNMRLTPAEGISEIINRLTGHKLFAHTTLTRVERSETTALVTRLFDEGM